MICTEEYQRNRHCWYHRANISLAVTADH